MHVKRRLPDDTPWLLYCATISRGWHALSDAYCYPSPMSSDTEATCPSHPTAPLTSEATQGIGSRVAYRPTGQIYTPHDNETKRTTTTNPSLRMHFTLQTHEADEAIDVHHARLAQGAIDVHGRLASCSCN